MKQSSSGSSLHSKTFSSFSVRKRLFSLRSVVKTIGDEEKEDNSVVLKKLEKALEADNKEASQCIAEPDGTIPGFEQLSIEHKLWKYFDSRMQMVRGKVQRQQVNRCEKQFVEIKRLVDKRREAHTFSLGSVQKIIKEKYRQIHQSFEEMKQQKMSKLITAMKNTKNRLVIPFDNSQKLLLLKENVETIRMEIAKLQAQYKTETMEAQKLLKEWKSLLINIVKKGYFMNDGVCKIFREMIAIDYAPVREDFPGFIDEATFNCFMRRYNSVKQEAEKQKEETVSEKEKGRNASVSIRNIRQIAKHPKLKKIYDQTRQYMVDWLKNETWKETVVLPRLKQKFLKTQNDWQSEQKKRMLYMYQDKQIYRRIKNMLFGPKVQILF